MPEENGYRVDTYTNRKGKAWYRIVLDADQAQSLVDDDDETVTGIQTAVQGLLPAKKTVKKASAAKKTVAA